MKVTFCAHDVANYISGPNTWLRRLLPDLKKQGVDVNVLFITHSEPALCPTVTALQNQGISCKIQSEYKYTEQHVQWILGSLRENPPDVFVSNLMVPAYYAARWAKEAGIPTVGVMHSDDKFYYGLLDEFVCGNPEYRLSALICVSEYLNHQVLLRKPSDTIIRKIPCGVPIPRSSALWPQSPLRLIYAGRLVEEAKCISEVTRALCRTVKEIPGTEAYIYGEGKERPAVERILLHEGKTLPVYLKGPVDSDKIQQHLLSGHIFVLLSDYEGLPISLMEAMACGLVPVCLKVPSGIPELVNDGTNGLLVPDRGNSFINAVRSLREDKGLWERLSKAACDKIKNGYSHENCVKLWITLLDDLNSQRNGRKMIHIPNRIELPPAHQDLAREDQRTPTGLALLKRRAKRLFGFGKRTLKFFLPRQNRFRYNFLNLPCAPSVLEHFIVRNAIKRALKEVLLKFHGVLLDVGSASMPYKPLLIAEAKNMSGYISLDLKPSERYPFNPDLIWDGKTIPLQDNAVNCAIATEVFEHFPNPETVMVEILRVLEPGGILFFTVPFLWRLHTVPFDEYRYTPFSLERHLRNAGFGDVKIKPLGGPDASLGQILALWATGRSRSRLHHLMKPVITFLCTPIVWLLAKLDTRPTEFYEGCLITGLSGTAAKPNNTSTKS
jgi:colanic acid/amylovoran biosynthesis glycosyltransferase